MDCGIINWLLKFADNTKLFGKVQTQLDYDGLQKDLQRLLDWSREWQMEFNIDKCKIMHIGSSNRNFRYYMENQELQVVKEENDLGLLITNDLKASNQCSQACNKANKQSPGNKQNCHVFSNAKFS